MFAAADRNKDATLSVLCDLLPEVSTVLEIASGGGQHMLHFSAVLPHLDWCASERNPNLVTNLHQQVRDGSRVLRRRPETSSRSPA